MATRAQLRTWLRRRLQETSEGIWTNSVLNSYLNEGLQVVSAAIALAEPEFVIYQDLRDITINEDLYLLPTNCDRVIEVWALDDDEYVQLEFRRRKDQNDPAKTTTTTSYSLQGRYIRIHPMPAATVVEGIRLFYVPILSLSSETEVPPIPVNLQKGVVYAAQIIAYGDTAETTDKDYTQKELDAVLNTIRSTYDQNADQDEMLTFPSNLRITSQDVE